MARAIPLLFLFFSTRALALGIGCEILFGDIFHEDTVYGSYGCCHDNASRAIAELSRARDYDPKQAFVIVAIPPPGKDRIYATGELRGERHAAAYDWAHHAFVIHAKTVYDLDFTNDAKPIDVANYLPRMFVPAVAGTEAARFVVVPAATYQAEFPAPKSAESRAEAKQNADAAAAWFRGAPARFPVLTATELVDRFR